LDKKPIFDAVRRLLGRAFRQVEVEALDAAIDSTAPLGERDAPERPWELSEAGIALIKRFEGCAELRPDGRVEAYPDPGTGSGPWTIGWGATGTGIGPGTIWSQRQCDDRLKADLRRYAGEVAKTLGETPTSQAQFDALVSFHYNTGAIGRATLTRLHKAGDHAGAAREFARWNRAGGRVLPGLVCRRAAEAAHYRSGRAPQ
jgi:GH24 family phage-related lysozyme (muramidase)